MPILTPEERVGSTMAGKYRLESILATGGMATVYAGVHAWTERECAVKILNYEHAREPEIVRRFLQEARAAAQLKHPNVVDVLDMGEDTDGTVYLVLERLHGETLKARMKRSTLSLREIGSLILPVMRAVAAAHGKGVVHRDIKPDNIFLAKGEGNVVVSKLLDFGIAKVVTTDSGSTRTGMMVGTPSYMAPEQVRGERDVGPPADVWSMGVVLHAAITGHVPFEGETSAAVLARVITERARPISTLAPNLRASVAAVVDRALVFEQQERFADMGQMVAALELALDGPSEGQRSLAPPATPVSRAPLASVRPAAAASAPGGPFVPESPTMQLHDRDLDQVTSPAPQGATSAAMIPAATPFAWAPAPVAAPEPPPARWPWILGGLAATAIAGFGLSYAFLGGSDPVATPVAIPLAAPPPSSAITVEAPTTTVEVVPGTTVAVDMHVDPVATPASADPDAGTALAEPPPVTAVAAPTTTARETTVRETTAPATTVRAPRDTRPVETAPREPQRGTGGALILRPTTEPDHEPESTRPQRTPQRGTGGALILH